MKKIITFLMAFGLVLLSSTGWGQYAGTGTFTKITSIGDLTDGYYVITNQGDEFAMNNIHNGTYLDRTAISPSSDELTDPSTSIVWKIETNGDGRSIYNEDIEKYVSYTGSTNNVQIVDEVTADNQRWTFTYADNKFTVKNLQITSRQLSYNSESPRFACYGNDGQQELQLYKMGEATNDPLIIVNPITLTGFTYLEGNGPSASQSFTVSGSNLIEDITISPPTNYEISEDDANFQSSPITLTQTDGTVNETTIYVRLKAGLAIGTYNDEDITATSTDAVNKTITCSGSVTDPNVNVEDFANYPETGTSYNTGTFLGQDGSTWNYVKCAGASAGNIDAPTPYLGKNQSPSSEVYSGTISGGIGTLSFEYMQVFSSNVDLNVLVNDVVVSNVTSGQQGVVLNSGDIELNIAGDFVLKFAQNGSGGQVAIDNVSWTPFEGNILPNITNITQNPASDITSSTTVEVSAEVTDSDGTIASVNLKWGTTSEDYSGGTISMTNGGSGDIYTTNTDIPAQTDGTTVYYIIEATDNETATSTSAEQSYLVTDPADEPTNHPTGFMATANSFSTITVVWADSDAEAYLIKGSDVDFASIPAPLDGKPETDGALVQNVASGVQSHQFTGLSAETAYYFKIFPYNGANATINYKTDSSVPESTATTDEAPPVPQLIISEVADPGDVADAKFVELFNASDSPIDLTNWQIRRYANANTTSADVDLIGSIYPNETYIVAYNATFESEFGFAPDLINGNISGNGDDTYELFNGVQVVDIYGEVGVDGTGEDWEYTDSHAVRNSDVSSPNATWTASEWTITAADVADMTPGEHNGYVYFVGTADWNTAANWSNNKVPTSTNNVIIPAAKSNVEIAFDATADCYNLTLNGSLTIKSEATGTGSLLVNGIVDGTGSTTIERYVTGGENAGGGTSIYKYHLISIPLASDIQAGDVFTGTYLWHFVPNQADEASWLGITSLTENLDNQKGFLSYVADESDKFIFTGTMNNGDFTVAAESIEAENVKLIPNPYPSAIDWEAVDLTDTGLNPTIWLFNSTTGNYESYNDGAGLGQQYIPVGQAVFVEAASADPSLTFTNAHRTHNQGNGFYKSGDELAKDLLKIAVSANNSSDATFIRFREQANNAYNGFDDATKLKGFSGAPQLFTHATDGKALSINTLATSQETVIVPLSFELDASGEAVLSFEYLETFEPEVEIYLEDLLTDQMINIRETGHYTFSHEVENDPLRFNLHFMGVTAVQDLRASENHFKVWTNENQLYILPTDKLTEGSLQIELFDLSGRLIQSVDKQVKKPVILSLPDYEGIMLVRIRNEKLVQTQKIFIR